MGKPSSRLASHTQFLVPRTSMEQPYPGVEVLKGIALWTLIPSVFLKMSLHTSTLFAAANTFARRFKRRAHKITQIFTTKYTTFWRSHTEPFFLHSWSQLLPRGARKYALSQPCIRSWLVEWKRGWAVLTKNNHKPKFFPPFYCIKWYMIYILRFLKPYFGLIWRAKCSKCTRKWWNDEKWQFLCHLATLKT